MRLPISVCVITRNEERHLRECLESVREHVEEIVVLDSLSTDRTQEIAREFTRRVFEQPFRDFSSQKNRCVALASHDWVLVLDADERIPEHAWPRIARVLAQARRDRTAAFAIPRVTRWVDGRFYRWVAYSPNFQWRLYDRRRCRYVGRIHEVLQIEGSRGCVRTEFLHEPDNSREVLFPKARLYHALQAQESADPSEQPLSPLRRARRKLRDFGFYIRVFLVDLRGVDEGPMAWFFALGWLSIFLCPPLREVFRKERLWSRRFPQILPYLNVSKRQRRAAPHKVRTP